MLGISVALAVVGFIAIILISIGVGLAVMNARGDEFGEGRSRRSRPSR